MTLAVELHRVSRRYGQRWALKNVDLELAPGRALLLTGHNGSGKTTLLRLLGGALLATNGQARILGFDHQNDRDEVRRRVGLLSHASHLYEDLSARENLALMQQLLRQPGTEIDRVLDRVGLSNRADHPVRQFSAGMKKRLAIGRLLIKKPALVLLDEPFGELDPAGMIAVERLIEEFKANGAALVLATHWLEQGRRLCDETVALNDGSVVR